MASHSFHRITSIDADLSPTTNAVELTIIENSWNGEIHTPVTLFFIDRNLARRLVDAINGARFQKNVESK